MSATLTAISEAWIPAALTPEDHAEIRENYTLLHRERRNTLDKKLYSDDQDTSPYRKPIKVLTDVLQFSPPQAFDDDWKPYEPDLKITSKGYVNAVRRDLPRASILPFVLLEYSDAQSDHRSLPPCYYYPDDKTCWLPQGVHTHTLNYKQFEQQDNPHLFGRRAAAGWFAPGKNPPGQYYFRFKLFDWTNELLDYPTPRNDFPEDKEGTATCCMPGCEGTISEISKLQSSDIRAICKNHSRKEVVEFLGRTYDGKKDNADAAVHFWQKRKLYQKMSSSPEVPEELGDREASDSREDGDTAEERENKASEFGFVKHGHRESDKKYGRDAAGHPLWEWLWSRLPPKDREPWYAMYDVWNPEEAAALRYVDAQSCATSSDPDLFQVAFDAYKMNIPRGAKKLTREILKGVVITERKDKTSTRYTVKFPRGYNGNIRGLTKWKRGSRGAPDTVISNPVGIESLPPVDHNSDSEFGVEGEFIKVVFDPEGEQRE